MLRCVYKKQNYKNGNEMHSKNARRIYGGQLTGPVRSNQKEDFIFQPERGSRLSTLFAPIMTMKNIGTSYEEVEK